MKRIIPAIILFTFLVCITTNPAPARRKVPIERAVVKVITVASDPNYRMPWQAGSQNMQSGSGAIIAPGRVLTNAHVVANGTYVQVQRQGDPTKYPAKVLVVGHECDLALLEVDDPNFMNGVEPLPIGEMPMVRDKVAAMGFPVGGDKLSITEGVVSRIEIGQYSHSWKSLPQIQIDAAINPGNSGGPVIMDDKIVGIAFQSLGQTDNVGYMIPPQVIGHFLEDAKDGSYEGFPAMGITWGTLENPHQRAYLGMKKTQTGVVVTGVAYNSSSWEILKEKDVILSFDGHDITNDGTVPFVGDERILFSWHLTSKYPGDNVNVRILRGGEEKELTISLKQETQLVSVCEFDVMPSYYTWGGLVFAPLSLNYLIWNQNPRYTSPEDLMFHLLSGFPTPEQTQVVIIQMVLADKVNVGYHDIQNLIVSGVNGERIGSMTELIGKIESAKGEFISIETQSGRAIVLGRVLAAEATARIMERYRIPADRSEDLR